MNHPLEHFGTARPRNVLVTGGSRGIGAAIVAQLISAGAKVYATTRKDGDLSDPMAPARLWQQAVEAFDGCVDVLINNAGIYEELSIDCDEETWLSSWDRTLNVNLIGVASLCRHAVRHFKDEGRGGRIVNIASRAAHRGDSPSHWHYGASKAGILALTKTIARGYAKDNILSFAVCPGYTATEMVETYLSDTIVEACPLGRAAAPDEVAIAAVFLALNAPPSMTGAIVDVNGASYVR